MFWTLENRRTVGPSASELMGFFPMFVLVSVACMIEQVELTANPIFVTGLKATVQ